MFPYQQIKLQTILQSYVKGITSRLWDKNLSLLCKAVDQYALQLAKWEMVVLSVISSGKEMVKGQIEERIFKLK